MVSYLIKKDNRQYLKLFLAFSGAFLLGITFLNLIPETYERMGSQAGYFIIFGFCLQIVIDFFSEGVEHGHMHGSKERNKFPISIFLALSIHALIEGVGLGSGVFSAHIQTNLMFGIALHEIPACFALVVILKNSGNLRTFTNIAKWIALYSFMVPLGYLIGHYFGEVLSDFYIFCLMGIVIGIFLHISTTILFENNENHKYGAYKIAAIIIGLGIALLANQAHLHT